MNRKDGQSSEPVFYGDMLKHYRTAAKLSQQELGDKMGLSYVSIDDFERGFSVPSKEQ